MAPSMVELKMGLVRTSTSCDGRLLMGREKRSSIVLESHVELELDSGSLDGLKRRLESC